jgi:hypothetical protein
VSVGQVAGIQLEGLQDNNRSGADGEIMAAFSLASLAKRAYSGPIAVPRDRPGST